MHSEYTITIFSAHSRTELATDMENLCWFHAVDRPGKQITAVPRVL